MIDQKYFLITIICSLLGAAAVVRAENDPTMSQYDAIKYCKDRLEHLPRLGELSSLNAQGKLNKGQWYWSAEVDYFDPKTASVFYDCNYVYGCSQAYVDRNSTFYAVRCVPGL